MQVCEIAPLDPAEVGYDWVGLWVGILGHWFLILATFLTLRQTKKNCVLGISLVVWGL